MRKNGRTAKRLKKLLWPISKPAWADNHGIQLPVNHPAVSEGIARQIYFGEYEAKEIEIIERRLTDDDIVLEVGAGLGYLSAFCARRLGAGRVFTYEANPELIPLIQATHARNNVAPVLTNALLAKGSGEREFFLEQDFWASSAHHGGGGSGRAIKVRQVDLNEELGRIQPSFLIVDIEGGEAEFFGDADLASVRKICVETHPGVLTDRQLSDMFGKLFAQGFALDFTLMRKNVFFLHRT
jgi:FkbM family methyltransferase